MSVEDSSNFLAEIAIPMEHSAEELGVSSDESMSFLNLVEELNAISSLELGKLLKESENSVVELPRDGYIVQIDVEKLASSLPLHLLAVLLSNGECELAHLLRGMKVLFFLAELVPQHARLEQILLEEIKGAEQVLDLVFYLLIVLASYGQETGITADVALLHSTLVANSFYLLNVLISSQWQDLVPVLASHPKVDVFMDATFDSVHMDIRFLSGILSTLNSNINSHQEKIANHICHQCEAALQFLLSLCQQKIFRDRLLSNKELCKNGGILYLACKVLNLNNSQCARVSSLSAAILRLKSKILAILLQLCEAENVSYLDEVAGSEKSMDLAKSVVLEILDLLKDAFCAEVNWSTRGMVVLNSMKLADIFSDDSNFRSFFMSNITKVLAEILTMPHEDFFLRWCSTEVPMSEEDVVLEYDPCGAAVVALTLWSGSVDFCGDDEAVLLKEPSENLGSLASYAQQRISYLVKIVANLHCFVPDLCEEEEKYLFLNKFLESLQTIPPQSSSGVQRAAMIHKNLGSLSVYAESLVPSLLNEEDVQLLSDFCKQILESNPPSTLDDNAHG